MASVARVARAGLIAFLVVFIGIQFVRPDRTNPPSEPTRSLLTRATPEVRRILERACRDCHSSETEWPPYSAVAPMSWLVASHVHEGRDHFNYSEWTALDSDEQDKLLNGMCSLTKRGRMPLPSYLWIHRGSALSPSDVETICAWSDKMRDTLQ